MDKEMKAFIDRGVAKVRGVMAVQDHRGTPSFEDVVTAVRTMAEHLLTDKPGAAPPVAHQPQNQAQSEKAA